MLKAKLRLDWMPSASSDVVSQHLSVFVNNGKVVDEVLDHVASSFSFKAPEHAQVGVELKAFDGTQLSDAATLSFNVGDLGKPLAPTGLSITVEEVVDEE